MELTIRWQDQSQASEKTISDKETTQIGRARDNQIRFRDQRVSRRHATISAKDKKWYLKNISSNNIVRKGGHRVDPGQEVVLREGDIFQVGPIHFNAVAGDRTPKLQCARCNHIVEHKAHEFCPWCGLSLNLAETVYPSS